MRKLILATALTLAGGTADAADAEGHFGIKGIGASACAEYVQAAGAGSPLVGRYLGWANGYLTRLNQTDPDTFDILPWQSTRMLYVLLGDYCQQHPDKSFGTAVYALTKALQTQRLSHESGVRQYTNDNGSVFLYEEVLRRAQKRLNEATGAGIAINGNLDDATTEALEKFQQANQLQASGLPDEPTLQLLFYPGE